MSAVFRNWVPFSRAPHSRAVQRNVSNHGKFPRGRPRKPHPLDWLRELPPFDLEPNITEETHREYKRLREEDRRERVGDALRDEYPLPGGKANAGRATAKRRRISYIYEKYRETILNRALSDSTAARVIMKRERDNTLKERTMRGYVSRLRKDGKAK